MYDTEKECICTKPNFLEIYSTRYFDDKTKITEMGTIIGMGGGG